MEVARWIHVYGCYTRTLLGAGDYTSYFFPYLQTARDTD